MTLDSGSIDGNVFARGDDGYEEARRATVWNARIPDRFPDLVVQATNTADVQAVVRHASAEGLRVGIRSGGHSWSASHVRDGGLLLDMSRMNSVEVDTAAHRAVVGPGRKGHELCAQLEDAGMFFPAGHCKGVAVGGYLLQGGYGWNSRVYGPACESVLGIDVVTADGELIHANAEQHSDLYWSARGSGPGFFGVVTAFHLRIYEAPAVCGSSLYVYPLRLLEDVYRWAHEIGPRVDRRVEVQIAMSRGFAEAGIDEPSIVIASPVFADTEGEAIEALSILETCPVRDQALLAIPYAPARMSEWYDAIMNAYPDGHRYAADNMWTNASFDELLPGLQAMAADLPPAPSHILWLNWGPSPKRQDMAYSLEEPIYIAAYAVWDDAAEDERWATWPAERMRSMEALASGIQLADENLGQRPAKFLQDENMARLDAARAAYDPDGRFHSWLGRL